jgi:hypothetical protein
VVYIVYRVYWGLARLRHRALLIWERWLAVSRAQVLVTMRRVLASMPVTSDEAPPALKTEPGPAPRHR